MKSPAEQKIVQWLDAAGASMGGAPRQRRDALLELEMTIHERLEEHSSAGLLPDAAVQDVLDAMGDPASVGEALMPMRALIEARHTRPFFLHTFILFAIHFLLVVGATMASLVLTLPPFRIHPMADGGGPLETLSRVVETFVFDAGLVLCAYLLLGRLGLLLRTPRAELAVLPDRRRCLEGAIFLALILIVVNFFRDNLLALYLKDGDGTMQVPLVGPGILHNLILFNVWLLASVARDLAYVFRGEHKWTLGADLLACGLGVFCLLRMVATAQLIDLSPAADAMGAAADNLGAMLNTSLTLLMLLAAAILSVRAVRRVFRLALLP